VIEIEKSTGYYPNGLRKKWATEKHHSRVNIKIDEMERVQ